ncbi:MAG: RNB domain-containing ribonuclease, partial [Actinomycetes bacterium]
MPRRHLRLRALDGAELRAGFAKIRAELGLPDGFAADVKDAADAAVRCAALPSYDVTWLPFLTIDPPGSMDLD